MLHSRTALISALLAVASLGLAGCGSATGPSAPVAPGAAPGLARSLSVGVTDGHLGDAITDQSGGRLRELSPGGRIDPAAPLAPNLREGVGAGDACANATLMPSASNLATVAEATLCLLNGERGDRGLATLRPNQRLQRAALGHGSDMVEHRYFAHQGRDGSQPAERIRAAGYLSAPGQWRIGENLAWGTGNLATPRAIMNAWMNSAGHRANILQPAYREIGFGVLAGNPASAANGGATFVTEFGFVAGADRTASARRAAAKVRLRRAGARKVRARSKARRARARKARARAALAPRSRRGRIVGSVADVRTTVR
jgi:uncharacterized protein YkwD